MKSNLTFNVFSLLTRKESCCWVWKRWRRMLNAWWWNEAIAYCTFFNSSHVDGLAICCTRHEYVLLSFYKILSFPIYHVRVSISHRVNNISFIIFYYYVYLLDSKRAITILYPVLHRMFIKSWRRRDIVTELKRKRKEKMKPWMKSITHTNFNMRLRKTKWEN